MDDVTDLLPLEVWTEVMKYFGPRDLRNCRKVSRTFKWMADDYKLFSMLYYVTPVLRNKYFQCPERDYYHNYCKYIIARNELSLADDMTLYQGFVDEMYNISITPLMVDLIKYVYNPDNWYDVADISNILQNISSFNSLHALFDSYDFENVLFRFDEATVAYLCNVITYMVYILCETSSTDQIYNVYTKYYHVFSWNLWNIYAYIPTRFIMENTHMHSSFNWNYINFQSFPLDFLLTIDRDCLDIGTMYKIITTRQDMTLPVALELTKDEYYNVAIIHEAIDKFRY